MTDIRQEVFDRMPGQDIAAPNEPHLACVLLLDTSDSMTGKPIESLNEALIKFKEQTSLDELCRKRLDIAIVEFNSQVRVVQDFVPLTKFEPPRLEAHGLTSMGAGINLAIDLVKERNRFYDQMGTPVHKPWIFMITDGAPTDDIEDAKKRIQEEESKGSHGKLKFWAIGVKPNYDKELLTSLTERCIEIDTANFEGIFNWLSESMALMSRSRVGENPQLDMLPEGSRIIPGDW